MNFCKDCKYCLYPNDRFPQCLKTREIMEDNYCVDLVSGEVTLYFCQVFRKKPNGEPIKDCPRYELYVEPPHEPFSFFGRLKPIFEKIKGIFHRS
jgi:hypothetical protein